MSLTLSHTAHISNHPRTRSRVDFREQEYVGAIFSSGMRRNTKWHFPKREANNNADEEKVVGRGEVVLPDEETLLGDEEGESIGRFLCVKDLSELFLERGSSGATMARTARHERHW